MVCASESLWSLLPLPYWSMSSWENSNDDDDDDDDDEEEDTWSISVTLSPLGARMLILFIDAVRITLNCQNGTSCF